MSANLFFSKIGTLKSAGLIDEKTAQNAQSRRMEGFKSFCNKFGLGTADANWITTMTETDMAAKVIEFYGK